MSHIVYLALGTNLGDRLANLQRALEALPPTVQILQRSPVYQTPPWGILDQPDFLNQVIKGETESPPLELLTFLKGLESRLGRLPGVRNGPRLIDLDLLFYDNLVLKTSVLTIPHPRMRGRGFVLLPLADLAPDLVHPEEGRTIRQMLQEADCTGIVLFEPSNSSGGAG